SSPARSSLFLYSSPPPLSPLPLHDALPLSDPPDGAGRAPSLVGRLVGSLDALRGAGRTVLARRAEEARSDRSRHPVLLVPGALRSEEHTSELQSRFDIVCRLLLEKKNDREQ